MAGDATSWVMTHPSHFEPGVVVQYNQRSDFIHCLMGGAPRVQLASEDKQVYLRQVGLRTKVQAGQAGANQVPSCSITTGLASAPTYLQQARATYDHHETAMLAAWNISIVEANRLGMQQGHYQSLRDKALYGVFPQNGEGIVNGTGITTTALPADSFGQTRISTYDNGQMALFILTIFQQLKTRTYQMGQPQRFVVLGPQQDLAQWEMQDVVQITSYQRPGAGSETVVGMVQDVLAKTGNEVVFGYDDTLIGQGPGGTDLILFIMPELKKPEGNLPGGAINTNRFADLMPAFNGCVTQYTDVVAPIEIATPVPGGGTDVFTEMRATAGWDVRPEAVTVLYAAN